MQMLQAHMLSSGLLENNLSRPPLAYIKRLCVIKEFETCWLYCRQASILFLQRQSGGWAAGEHTALALLPSPLKSSLILWGLARSYSWCCSTKFVMTKYCKTMAEHSQGQQSKARHSHEITDLIQWTSIGNDMTFDLQQEAKKNSHGFTNSSF